MDVRGVLNTDEKGEYKVRTVAPIGYSIPMDGPVGDLIKAQKRHGFRPAHIHFLINAPGFRELVTALYLGDDGHIESDTVFGVSESLVVNPKKPKAVGEDATIQFDFTLSSEKLASSRVGADPSQFLQPS